MPIAAIRGEGRALHGAHQEPRGRRGNFGNGVASVSDEPASLEPAFTGALELVRREGIIEKYRVLGGHVPAALDGTWYHASEEMHCKHCLTMTKKVKGEERTLYYHDVVAAAIVAPGNSVVLPLMPEMVRNEDGTEKQDAA